MKCAKCGAELKVGCIYCSVCGQEAQIVPDYNLLEDDFLKELLKEEKKTERKASKKNTEEKKPKNSKKKKKKIIISTAIATVILAIILIVFLINHRHNNSYDYQMEKAGACVQDKEYIKAQKYLKRAIELKKDSTDARLMLAEVYIAREEKDDAIEALKKVLELDDANEEAYRELIAVYESTKDYEAITELAATVEDSKCMDLFADYIVTAPVPNIEPGKYGELLTIELSAQTGTTVYYTLDGSDPKQGEKYTEPIALIEGTTTLKMISVNELGIYSEETKAVYTIEFQAPDAPEVTPDGGSFNLPQQITIKVPEGCRAYYTWDGSDPTAASAEYTGPLETPEGNNILSVILMNEHELCSDVTKCNFIYIP